MTDRISMDKTYRTRDGKEVKLLMLDGGGKYPVLGAVKDSDTDSWEAETWNTKGGYDAFVASNTENDLIEVAKTEKLDVWANVFMSGAGTLNIGGGYPTKEEARRNLTSGTFATIRVGRVLEKDQVDD